MAINVNITYVPDPEDVGKLNNELRSKLLDKLKPFNDRLRQLLYGNCISLSESGETLMYARGVLLKEFSHIINEIIFSIENDRDGMEVTFTAFLKQYKDILFRIPCVVKEKESNNDVSDLLSFKSRDNYTLPNMLITDIDVNDNNIFSDDTSFINLKDNKVAPRLIL